MSKEILEWVMEEVFINTSYNPEILCRNKTRIIIKNYFLFDINIFMYLLTVFYFSLLFVYM